MTPQKRKDGFEIRQYQVELINKIKQQNAILYLPTGSGKTFIALEVIKLMQKDLQKPVNEGGKRTIFLVNTVALVEQHYTFLKRHSSLAIIPLTGDCGVDLWKHDDWVEIEKNAQVLIMTAQIYVNVLTHGYLHLKNANLIIFDECHHAVNKHPMREVMTFFQQCDETDHPKILGLSATLLNANTTVLQFHNELKELENTFRSKIITSTRLSEVKRFSTKPNEISETFFAYNPPAAVLDKITELVERNMEIISALKLKEIVEHNDCFDKLLNDQGENRAKLLKNCLKDLLVHLKDYGMYFCFLGCTSYMIQLYRLMFEKSNDTLYIDAILLLINVLKAMRKILHSEISKVGNIDAVESVKKSCSEKVKYVLNKLILLKPDDKCIIFVERRMTAKILFKIIEMFFNEEKSSLVVDFMVGFSVHPLRNSREGDFVKRCHKKVMNKFRNGKINVLVASNVLEEGIDLPDCNIVFMYDFPKTFRSYIQSKGRARKEQSSYILLLHHGDDKKSWNKINEYRKLEQELENVVHQIDIAGESDAEQFATNDEEMYKTLAEANLTKTQAIPIISLYCSTLPHDIFTELSPYWWKQKVENGVICRLQFPMNAAISEVIGPVCENIKEAKQAVAFEAVKLLHQCNALNDNLMPVLVPYQTEDEEYWFPNWDDNVSLGDGTRSQKFEVDMKIPTYLMDCRPIPNTLCYLHVINIIPEYPKPDLPRRLRCHNLLTSKFELGFVTKNPLPAICDFPVYSDLGRVRVKIDTNRRSMTLNEKEIKGISIFHRFFFLKALQIVKKCLLYNKDDGTNGYFMVPLLKDKNNKMDIAWKVVFEQSEISDIIRPSEKERKAAQYTKENYLGSVVVPWYRQYPKKIQYFVVTDAETNLMLDSPFTTPRHETFAAYYKNVYDLEALRPLQPLMEVRPITHHLDGIRPKSTSTDKSEKKKSSEKSIYIAPEFCIRENFPAVYWYKGTVIPSILHRLNHLLLAEEIREKISLEAGIGNTKWTKGPLDFLECAEKYELKKNLENKVEKSEAEVNIKKPRFRRKALKNERCLAKILEDETLPIDLERGKNISLNDIEKFVSYILKRLDLESDTTTDEESRASEHLNHFPNVISSVEITYNEPPSLMTLIERPNYEGPRQHEILEALTPVCCHDIIDLERLETLGDSFLKFAVSFTIFVKCKKANEGHMTTLKGRLVGNRNLLHCGNKLNLGSYLKLNRFSAYNNWCPPGFTVPERLRSGIKSMTSPSVLFYLSIPFNEQFSGSISPGTISTMKEDFQNFLDEEASKPEVMKAEGDALAFLNKQSVSGKTIADAVEALIGIYVKTGGIQPAFKLLNYFGVVANPTYEEIMETKAPSPLLPRTKLTIEDLVPNYRKLEDLLQYKFNDKAYIVQALSHPTYLKNNMTGCYQILEFIGDAVLDFLITSYIFEYCGNLPPGKLTDLRASLVNNNTFGAFTVRLGLHKFLLSNNKKLTDALNRFIEYQEQMNYEIHGNELMILLSEDDVKMAEEVEIPKVLGDIFESVAGAIFLDSGNSLQTVWRIYYNIMKEEIKKFSENIPINPLRALYEEPGLKIKFLSEMVKPTEDPKLKRFVSGKLTIPLRVIKDGEEFLYYGRGENTDLCKRAAAKLALKDLGRNEFVI